MKTYIYKVIRENPDGSTGKKPKNIRRSAMDLNVGGLYLHLGKGYPGMQRVISLEVEEVLD